MKSVILLTFTSVFLVTACSEPAAVAPASNSLQLEADVRFLADDKLEGREAGTRGYDISAMYVAEKFRSLGLEPGGGDGTYLQQVPLREDRLDPEGRASLTIGDGDAQINLIEDEDYVVFSTARFTEVAVEAPAVFVGFGLVSEKHGRDDYAGLDVNGKFVIQLIGAPKFLNSEERAHQGNVKWKTASDRGAIGSIGITTEEMERIFPFARGVEYFKMNTSMNWTDADGQPFSIAPNIQAGAFMSLAGGEKVISHSGQSWSEVVAAAETDEGLVPSFDMGLTARIEVDSLHRELTSPNVVGILPGSDPILRDEYVILMGHLDHDGIKPTDDPDDDEIYNGAMDNAVGIAAMLEVARMLSLDPPKRSVVFVALAAEEKGLEGSDYYARNPTVPADAMVAAVNLDMPIVTYDFTDVVAFGAERSTLFPIVEAAVEANGLTLSPDPAPEQGFFTRSDHYSFVKQGVPSVYLDLGWANGGEEIQNDFLENHYHQTSDHVEHVDFTALAKFTDTKYLIARGIANMDERPVWKKGDFFGRTFNGPMEE